MSLDGQSTEAGIRQNIGADSRPVILDEFEGDRKQTRIDSIVRLARSAYTAESKMARGTPEGKAILYSLSTTFLFAAINPKLIAAADKSRFVLLELSKHENDRSVKAEIERAISKFHEVGPAWCSQMIELATLLLPSIEIVGAAMPPAESRHVTNISTLLGSAFLALNGRPPSKSEAEDWIAAHKSVIDEHGEAHKEDDALDCLNHLLAWHTDDRTIGICLALAHEQQDKYSLKVLATHGIRIEHSGDFYVAHSNPGLRIVFRDTGWSDTWGASLRRIDGASIPKDPVWVGGAKVRCVSLPSSLIPDVPPEWEPDDASDSERRY